MKDLNALIKKIRKDPNGKAFTRSLEAAADRLNNSCMGISKWLKKLVDPDDKEIKKTTENATILLASLKGETVAAPPTAVKPWGTYRS